MYSPNALPSKQAQKNFESNFWTGFTLIIVGGFLLLCATFAVLGAIMNVDILSVFLGNSNATSAQKGTAITVIAIVIVFLLGFVFIYWKRAGTRGVGADSMQTGKEFSNLTSDHEFDRALEFHREAAENRADYESRMHERSLESARTQYNRF